MPIAPGEEWRTDVPPFDEIVVCRTDAEAREAVVTSRRTGDDPPPLGLIGGDLWRSLGAPRGGVERLRGDAAQAFPVDVAEVLLDGRIDWFVAHLVNRNRWWAGRTVLAMNTEFLGPWKVAPRAHAGDGLIDVVDARLALRERLQARRRLPSGTHVPHPSIAIRRAAAVQLDLDGATTLLDGVAVGPVRRLTVRVLDHLLTVVV